MFTITATHTSNASGRAQVVAKGHGKQRTVSLDHRKNPDVNRAAAVGALLDVLVTPQQRAKLLHPSAKGRIRTVALSDFGGKERWTIDV